MNTTPAHNTTMQSTHRRPPFKKRNKLLSPREKLQMNNQSANPKEQHKTIQENKSNQKLKSSMVSRSSKEQLSDIFQKLRQSGIMRGSKISSLKKHRSFRLSRKSSLKKIVSQEKLEEDQPALKKKRNRMSLHISSLKQSPFLSSGKRVGQSARQKMSGKIFLKRQVVSQRKSYKSEVKQKKGRKASVHFLNIKMLPSKPYKSNPVSPRQRLQVQKMPKINQQISKFRQLTKKIKLLPKKTNSNLRMPVTVNKKVITITPPRSPKSNQTPNTQFLGSNSKVVTNKPISLTKNVFNLKRPSPKREKNKNLIQGIKVPEPQCLIIRGRRSSYNGVPRRVQLQQRKSSLFVSPQENLPESVQNLLASTQSAKIPDFNNLFDIEEADNSLMYITNPNIGKQLKSINGVVEETSQLSSEVSRMSQNLLDYIKEEEQLKESPLVPDLQAADSEAKSLISKKVKPSKITSVHLQTQDQIKSERKIRSKALSRASSNSRNRSDSKNFSIKNGSTTSSKRLSIHHTGLKRISKTPSIETMSKFNQFGSTKDTKMKSIETLQRQGYINFKKQTPQIKRIQTVEPDFMSSALAQSFKKHRLKAKQSFNKHNKGLPSKSIRQLNMFFKKNKMKKRQKTTRSMTTFTAPFTQGVGQEQMTLTCRIPSRKSNSSKIQQIYSSIGSIDQGNSANSRRIQLNSLSKSAAKEKKSLEMSLGSFRNRSANHSNLCKIVVSQRRHKPRLENKSNFY